ncbi:hypothetical protein WISP_43901 [Willisornis vidua]|uniref:SAM domain-containing protein n=1 Tax=Willisornis vidua TaxID=1566151 RepID=A0ABQ9DKG9_9PASS|nr:hypothetical protein WISP_43901 [Willisornis vidua]
MENFNLSEINWEHHASGTIPARRYLEYLDDNSMEQVIRELTWKDVFLDLLLVTRVDLMRQTEIGGHLGHSDHKVINFKIAVDRMKSASKTSTLDMSKDDAPRKSQCPELQYLDCKNDQLPADPELMWDLLLQVYPYKSMGSDGIHPRILKELLMSSQNLSQ